MRLALALAVALLACSSDDPDPVAAKSCASGQQIECACPAGGKGAQVCRADGSGYDACQGCKPNTDGGACDPLAGKLGPPGPGCVRAPERDGYCANCTEAYSGCAERLKCANQIQSNGLVVEGYCCDAM